MSRSLEVKASGCAGGLMERWVPKAVLFDFYGTLVESDDKVCSGIAQAIAAAAPAPVVARDVGAYWYETFLAMLAQSHDNAFRTQRQLQMESLERVIAHFNANVDPKGLVQRLYDYCARPAILPEVPGVLSKCRLPMCVVSSSDRADLQSALRHNRMHFDHTVTSEDCLSYKPRPEVFERALSLLGLESGDALHVGDSISADVRGAKALGIRVLWINRSRRDEPRGDDRPDFTSSDLTGLVELLG